MNTFAAVAEANVQPKAFVLFETGYLGEHPDLRFASNRFF
jgi:hypothetical protein